LNNVTLMVAQVLEQLHGSQSLAGTITRLAELRFVHVLGIGMILVWALSPLGGQSALRLLSIVPSSEFDQQQVSYAQIANGSSIWLSGSDNGEVQPAVTALFSAALLGAEQNTNETEDLWGNPKIPFFDELPEDEGPDGWRTVKNGTVPRYSSLIGVRLQGLCDDCKMTLPLETSYQTLSCKNVKYGLAPNETMPFLGYPWTGWLGNMSDPFAGSPYPGAQIRPATFFIGCNSYLSDQKPHPAEPVSLLYTTAVFPFGEDGVQKRASSVYNCTLETRRVEAEVACEGKSCKVNRMRKSTIDPRPTNWTPWHGDTIGFRALAQFFPFAAGYTDQELQQANPTDNFIFGESQPYNYTRFPVRNSTSDEYVSRRLTLALNTVYQASMMPFSVANGNAYKPLKCKPGDGEQLLDDRTWTFVDDCNDMNFTTATTERTFEVYKANMVWI
jgi:hypothetical protein